MIVAYLGGLNTRVAIVSLKILSKKKKNSLYNVA